MKSIYLMLFLLLIYGCTETKSKFPTPENPSPLLAEEQEFLKEWKLWNAQNISEYSFVVREACNCLPEEDKKVIVAENRLVNALFVPSNQPLSAEKKSYLNTIPGYFELINGFFKKNIYRIEVDYDEKYHFPKKISLDGSKMIADDEVTYFIKSFQTHTKTTVPQNTHDNDQLSCTEEYRPVCGKIQIECVTTPCNPIFKTFSNTCYLSRNKRATHVHEGKCENEL